MKFIEITNDTLGIVRININSISFYHVGVKNIDKTVICIIGRETAIIANENFEVVTQMIDKVSK